MRASQRDAVKLAEKHGLTVEGVELTGGNHYKMNVKNSHGQKAFFILSNTASDWRVDKKRSSLFRRFAEGSFNPADRKGGHQ